MDKLTIEEKAKAYDFSLKRAKRLYEQGTITESLSYVFPQLKKLGDGEVRKEIMQLIQGMHDADPRKERWLAWLEKQGEQTPAWSEKDEEMFMSLYSPNFTKEQRDWLKSLKDRIGCELNCTTMWKPSEKQMEALKEACDEHWEPDGLDPLYTLYQELKKLREE